MWPSDRVICVHAEERTTAAILLLAELYQHHVHVCHVARKEEVEIRDIDGWTDKQTKTAANKKCYPIDCYYSCC